MSPLAKLLIIDPQNDFCDLPEQQLPRAERRALNGALLHEVASRPALPVPGAHADMLTLASFVQIAGASINDITVTLDSHPYVAIERTTFWHDAAGNEVPAFTQITALSVKEGIYRVRNGDRIEPESRKPLTERVIELLTELEASGRHSLVVWPVHCVTGTWGANIHATLASALAEWELQAPWPVRKVLKGEYELAEHYGVFEAETPIYEVPSTRLNARLADMVSMGVDMLFVAGEASSHCVAASVDQLIKYRRGDASNIILLTDCMSPVTGFEGRTDDFLQRTVAAGASLMTTNQALRLLNH